MANDVRFDILATNKTQRAFQSVGKSLTNLRSGVNQTVGRVAKIGAAFSVAAVGATAALVKMRMTAIDNLAKTADKLGVTTEALAGLQHAAELSGVSAATFDKALQNMGVQVANAARGTGLAVKALDQLGINAMALSQMPLDKQMEAVAEAMQGVEKHSDRVRIAYELFGARGVGVLNMMKDGAEGMKSMASEAEMLGIAISRIDAAQIEAANDNVTRAQSVFEGFGNQLAVSLSPLISELAANFYQVALDTNEAGNVGDRVVRALVTGFGHVANAVLGIKIAIKGIQLVFALFMETFINGIATLSSSFDILIAGYNKVAEFFGKPTISNAFKKNAEMLADSFGHVAEGIKNDISDALNAPLPSDQINEFYDQVQMKARETAEVVAANAPGTKMIEDAENLASAVQTISLATSQSVQSHVSSILSTTQTQMGALQGIFAEGSAGAKAFFVVQQALAAGSAIVNGFMAAMSIRAAYAQLAALTANPALAAAGEVHAQVAQAMGFATAAMIAGQTLASFEGGGYTGMGARAGGLDGKGGYMAMVHPNETIIDHNKGQSAGMAAPVNVNFSIQANDTRDFDRLLTERRGVIVSLVNQALNNRGRSSLGRV